MGIESPVEMDSRKKKGEGWEVVNTGPLRRGDATKGGKRMECGPFH